MKTKMTSFAALVAIIASLGITAVALAGNCTSCGGTGQKKINATESQRCATCNGTGNVGNPNVCGTCNGKGKNKVNDKEWATCNTCGGSGKK